MKSEEYYDCERGLVVVSIEHMSSEGLSAEGREFLESRWAPGSDWIDLFDQALREYWTRTGELAAATPMYWFPPRVQHVCVVTDDDKRF